MPNPCAAAQAAAAVAVKRYTLLPVIPLHTAPAGLKFGRFHGEDVYTTRESERLVRLPMYYQLTKEDLLRVTTSIISFYKER